MRKINNIVVHCTATPQTSTIESIVKYWQKNLGWQFPGYHIIVEPNGEWTQLLHGDYVSNGVKNHNHDSFHISYIGGVDENGNALDNRTQEQKETLLYLLKKAKQEYTHATIKGHRDFPGVTKACPSFDALNEYKDI